MDKAYALLTTKSVDEEQRVIRGIATSPTPDRVLDIVDPFGVKVAADIPLFLYHDSKQVVGRAVFGKPTDKGIPFEARLPKITEPGALKDRVDEAWGMVRHGLITAVSIGFRVLDGAVERLKNGGIKYLKTEVFELSLVPVPAQPDAVITGFRSMDAAAQTAALIEKVKSLDHALLASSGDGQGEVTPPPGVSGKQTTTRTPKGISVKTIAEQIKDTENTRAAKAARMEDVMSKSLAEGRATDDNESEEFDSLDAEVKRLDADLVRLRKLEQYNIAKATPVAVQSNGSGAVEVRNGAHISVKSAALPPGIPFARFVMTMAAARGNPGSALDIAKAHYPDMPELHSVIEMAKSVGSSDFGQILKATVAAGTTQGTTFAAPLVNYQNFAGDFVEYLRPQTIIGKFGMNGVPGLRRVPFNVKIPAQTSGGAAGWVGEGAPKPLTSFDFSSTTMGWTKVAAIAVLTEELIRFSSPSAEALVRDSLAAAVIERIDIDFVLPSKAAVANVSPASITNGASTATSAGTTEVDVRADIRTLMGLYIAANMTPTNGVWIMPATVALQLSMLTNALGNAVYPTINMNGGTFAGMPVIVSQYVPSGTVILANASDIYLADDGQVVVDASREASVQFLDNPTNNSATGTATSMVSFWQTNSVGVRAERYINWQRRRAAAVAYLTGVSYTG